MPKMEIELTDEQFEKVEILKESGIDVGQAIDMLFEAKDKLLSGVDSTEDDESLVEKIKDKGLDVDSKAEILDENYGEHQATVDIEVMDYKHKIKWAREFFKF